MKIISIDIGSTFTKGALFEIENGNLSVLKKNTIPTTATKLFTGFMEVVKSLLELEDEKEYLTLKEKVPVYFSSSAKGGLKIVALGIVPDLTLKMAKFAALSAGGKVIKVFSYKLSQSDINEISYLNPDIILFTGGTDGGNEGYNLANAKLISESKISSVIIYAGNRSIQDEVTQILSNKELYITENILPEINTPNIEPAREKIRGIFLKKIVIEKGLNEIIDLVKKEPYPTPYSVYELVKKIPEIDSEWQDFCLIDMGGATTDFYSNCDDSIDNPSVIYKGIKEPKVKRTVEGDLGMRVNALSVLEVAKDKIENILEKMTSNIEEFKIYVKKVNNNTEYIPKDKKECDFDKILASMCVYYSALRHCGRLEEVYTPNGQVFMLKGKDLRKIKKIIATGGYFSNICDENILKYAESQKNIMENKELVLLPAQPEYLFDKEYILPLLGNIVSVYPKESVRMSLKCLSKTKN